MSCQKIKKGYTLVELLVVMALVAVLSGISLFAMQGARESGRDAERKSDLETIRSALELYKSDCDTYPNVSAGDFYTNIGSDHNFGDNDGGSCGSGSRIYLYNVPQDPVGGSNIYYYRRLSSFTYELCAVLDDAPTGSTGCGPSNNIGNYRVINP